MFRNIQNKWFREAINWLIVLAIAFVINLLVRDHVFAVTKIEGSSMMPTLESEQRVYLNRLAYTFGTPQRGDIVVFPAPHDEKDYIKRIIGLPGDAVEMLSGTLYINEHPQYEPYIDATTEDFGPVRVPAGHVFVMGDNRHPYASLDSRDTRVGVIDVNTLKGRVDLVLYPSPHTL